MENKFMLEWLYADMDELIDMAASFTKKEKVTDAGKQFSEISDGAERQFGNDP